MPPSSPHPILVTGAAGFIGSHLVDSLLADGVPVVGLDNFNDFYSPAIKQRNIEGAMRVGAGGGGGSTGAGRPGVGGAAIFDMVEADIRERDAVFEAFATHRPAVVVHLAAMAGVRPSIERPAYYTAVNVDGTVNLLDAAIAHGVERFIFASSSSVYGNNPKVPFAETDNVDHPISPYAATKKSCELIAHTYHHLHGLPVTALRFFTVFGPRQRPDLAIAKFLSLVQQNKPIPVYGDGTTSRDYTYIADIIAGVRAAIDRCRKFHIYNLGGNHPISLNDLIATIATVTGKTPQVDRRPLQPGDVERTWADLTRSAAELDYHPRTSIADGIAKQWAAMQ